MRSKRAYLAADAGGGGGITIENTTLEDAVRSDPGMESAGFRDLQPDPDVEYVVEGDPAAAQAEPEEIRGKSREELLEIVRKNQEELERERQARSSGADAIAQALKSVIPQPAAPAPIEGYRIAMPQGGQQATPGKSPKELEQELETRFIQQPLQVVNELLAQQLGPITTTFAENQARLGRKLALSDPESKKVYDKYAAEVEQFVAQTPVVERIKDPEIYAKAINAVRSSHISEFMQETVEAQVKAGVEAALKAMGLDPAKGIPAQGRPQPTAARLTPQAAPTPTKRTIQIPKAVMDEAYRTGKDPGILYEMYKDAGIYR